MPNPVYPIGVSINEIRMDRDAQGLVSTLTALVEVNYGTFGRPQTVSLLEYLSQGQREMLQGLVEYLTACIQNDIVGV